MVSLLRSASDADSISLDAYHQHDANGGARYPHTRALLSAMARSHRAAGEEEGEGEVSSGFVGRVVALLDEDHEDELKGLLKDSYAGMDDDVLEQYMLELMHKHRDDLDGKPFLLLSQARRPISRPSSRASMGRRPETPNSAPTSPLAYMFRRPHTPLASPLSTGVGQSSSYVSHHQAESPQASPTLSYAVPTTSYFAASLPASPLSSPRLLNAKASEFRPHPRPLSAASSNPGSYIRADSPDLWAHGSLRGPSNLAIAAPLIPDSSLLSRSGTPSSLRASVRPDELDDDNDPFDPFSKDVPVFPSILASDYEPSWEVPHPAQPQSSYDNYSYSSTLASSEPSQDSLEDDATDMLTDGMTPFDVLSSVFGASLAPSELEEALASNGYDFDRSMAWLVDRMAPPQPQAPPSRTQQIGGRNVAVISRDSTQAAGFVRGGRSGYAPPGGMRGGNARFVNGRPVPGGNRVCRYFLAGECLRADCRFSHDLERALCRFWLRGTCAKGEACEFLHHLPENVDVSGLTSQFAQANLSHGHGGVPNNGRHSPGLDEFPSLDAAGQRPGVGQGFPKPTAHDPGRTRFAAAVKKPAAPTPPAPRDEATLAARREAMGSAADSLHHRTAIVAPKPSPRLRLRPPSLLPTLATGGEVGQLYMQYRSRALQLGAARNACLSRAADAWRRGDGAAAKRFSREGHELNAKMAGEMAQAAANLVRERAKAMARAARSRDPGWTDDPGDARSRGGASGAGLGVLLGVARKDVAMGMSGGGELTSEERTEAALDLHALHANEAVEVLEECLLALEREHFYGLIYLVVGEEKHTGTQDVARGTSRLRLAAGVKEWLHRWGYPWSERDGVICVDPLTHL